MGYNKIIRREPLSQDKPKVVRRRGSVLEKRPIGADTIVSVTDTAQ
jgi:hypothetical protein